MSRFRNFARKGRRSLLLWLLLSYALLLVMSYGFPVTGDDWFFAPALGRDFGQIALRHIHILSADPDAVGMFHAVGHCMPGFDLPVFIELDFQNTAFEHQFRLSAPALVVADIQVIIAVKGNAHVPGNPGFRMHRDIEPFGDVFVPVNAHHAARHVIHRIVGAGQNQITVSVNLHAVGCADIRFRKKCEQSGFLHCDPPPYSF